MIVPNQSGIGHINAVDACDRHEHADELERLRTDCEAMAAVLMGPKVFVHESIVAEVDEILARHLGGYVGTTAIP